MTMDRKERETEAQGQQLNGGGFRTGPWPCPLPPPTLHLEGQENEKQPKGRIEHEGSSHNVP